MPWHAVKWVPSQGIACRLLARVANICKDQYDLVKILPKTLSRKTYLSDFRKAKVPGNCAQVCWETGAELLGNGCHVAVKWVPSQGIACRLLAGVANICNDQYDLVENLSSHLLVGFSKRQEAG